VKILKNSALGAAVAVTLAAQTAPGTRQLPSHSDVSPDLLTMMLSQPMASVQEPALYVHKHGPTLEDVGEAQTSSVTSPLTPAFVQNETVAAPAFSAVPGANFEGLGTGTVGYTVSVAPPDTTLAVGPNHLVQWVNSHIAIYNKAGLPLLAAPGFVAGNTLWSGFGGVCESTNRGDPIVAYDKIADRWVFSQFAFAVSGSNPTTPYVQCFAVTQGSNPAGPYNRYSYDFSTMVSGFNGSTGQFNDYGKIGVWPDAYYMTYNAFGGVPAGSNSGVILCAHERAAMIAGTAAVMLCAPVNFYGGGASFLPSDLEGSTTAPPAGRPNFMIRQNTTTQLRMLKFKVNNFSPGSFTFDDGFGGGSGSVVNIPFPILRACNGSGLICIPQPGTATQLDTLGSRLLYRLGYRNRGGVESLVGSMSEDPDGAGAQQAAIRWFELRAPAANPPQLFQNGTFNPDATNRWMPSIGMDKNGNIAMGYSVSSGTVFPGIRITGRLRSEVRNRMQSETTIINGTGSQTVNLSGTALTRWGDYSTMRVDPADDCTFWFTTEYMAVNGVFNWRTRIAAFKFPNCTP